MGDKDLTLLDRTSTGTSPVCHTPHHSLFDPPGTYTVCQLLKAFGFAAVDLEHFCVLFFFFNCIYFWLCKVYIAVWAFL